MPDSDSEWRFVDSFTVATYHCGLRAGDRVALRQDLWVRTCEGRHTGKVYRTGEVWDVLHGSIHDPGIVWFRQADGDPHSWADDPAIFDWFEVVPRPH